MTSTWVISAALFALPVPDSAVRASAERGVKRLEAALASYVTHRSCFSCHHQATSLFGLAAARERGFSVDANVLEKQSQFTAEFFKTRTKDLRAGKGLGGGNTSAVYGLLTLRTAGRGRDDITDAIVELLLKKQQKDGSWPATSERPPSQGSRFTNGALALEGLKRFAPPADDDCEPNEQRERIEQARKQGLAYLQSSKPQSTEDRVFRLWGLLAGGAGEGDIAKARDELRKQQRTDGGWAQLDDMKSDAYATGSSLVVLRMAGVPGTDEAYRRGVRYLVLTQHDSGGWIVTTRSKPIQQFFDNGDPGGKSQFISTAATGWAVAALAGCFERK
jgi:hypothetical protein